MSKGTKNLGSGQDLPQDLSSEFKPIDMLRVFMYVSISMVIVIITNFFNFYLIGDPVINTVDFFKKIPLTTLSALTIIIFMMIHFYNKTIKSNVSILGYITNKENEMSREFEVVQVELKNEHSTSLVASVETAKILRSCFDSMDQRTRILEKGLKLFLQLQNIQSQEDLRVRLIECIAEIRSDINELQGSQKVVYGEIDRLINEFSPDSREVSR